jgi:multiple sugar transport system substrate-binding protein
MSTKTVIRWAAGAAALALTLTACGSSSTSSSGGGGASASVGGAAAATAAGGTTASGTISYWLWDSNQLPAYQACADAFHTANPTITVKVSQYGWDSYWSKITNGFTSGTGPDVFTDHLSKYPEFVSKQEILSISDALTADKYKTDIYQPGLLSLWTAQDHKIYGLPKDFDTIGLFYNKKMLTDAGMTLDQLNKLAWNSKDGGTFEKAVAHLTIDKSGKRGDQAGFDPKNVKTYGLALENGSAGNGQTQWSTFTGSAGWTYTDKNPWGTKYNYNDPKFQDTLTWYRSLITKGYMPSQDKVIGIDTGAQLGAGNYAMTTEGDWNTSGFTTLKGVSIGVANVPVGPTGKRASMFNGLADSINASTKNQAASIKWVEFTGSSACQDIVASKAVVFPAIPEATDKAVAAFKAKGQDMTPFTDRVTDKETFLFPITDHAADITAIMDPAMQSFLSFKTDAGAFTDANTQVNALFN